MREESVKRKTKTVEALENSILELLEEKELSEITVVEICKKAAVHHSTFYLHYYDQRDLYESVIENGNREISAILEEAFRGEMPELVLRDLVSRIKDSKYFVRLIKQKNNSAYRELIINNAAPILDEKMKRLWHDGDREYVIGFMLNGTVSIIETWIKHAYEEESYIANLIFRLCSSLDLYHH